MQNYFSRWMWVPCCAALLFSACTAEKTTFITIGTGGVTGVYYPTGGAVARMINDRGRELKLRASAESTGGSVFNVNAVLSGDLEFGIAQSDRQYQAYKGLAEWKEKGPQKDLRAVCSFHSEVITLVAAVDSGIRSLKDLIGKRVNIGNPGSGQRGNAIEIFKTAGLDWEKGMKIESLKPSEAPKFLQDKRIDAFFYTVGHPSGAITEATAGQRKVRFIPITGMQKLIARSPYYAESDIPIALYPQAQNKEDTPSIGVKATFITSAKLPEEVVYKVTKTLFEHLDEFKKLHPALARLTPEGMLKGLGAPLHPGARKYYREKGLI